MWFCGFFFIIIFFNCIIYQFWRFLIVGETINDNKLKYMRVYVGRNEITKKKWTLCELSFVFVFLQIPNLLSFTTTNRVSVDFSSLATQIFQFVKFEKSKEHRLATKLGHGFSIGGPWITNGTHHGLLPLKASILLNAPKIHQMHFFKPYFKGPRKPNPSRQK